MNKFTTTYNRFIKFMFIFWILPILSQDNSNKYIFIEWEKNTLAAEYQLQISDSVKFLNITFQKKTKESLVRLDTNPIYKYGRIAAIDQFGIRGEYSEVFQIEQRIIEKKISTPTPPLPLNFVSVNHRITLDLNEDKTKFWKTHYKINDGIWQIYNGAIQLTKEGSNIIQYFSEDRLGNKETIKAKEYILDTLAPDVEIHFSNSYEDNNRIIFTNKNSAITINAQDWNSGIESIKTYLRSPDDFREFSWKDKITIPEDYAEKLIELKIIATDRIGNIKSYSKFLKHDLTPPMVSIDTIRKYESNKRQISISQINAHDSNSGLRIIQYSINNSDLRPYLEPILISEPGEYEVRFRAIDNVGNKTTFQYERIFIPETPNKNQNSTNKLK